MTEHNRDQESRWGQGEQGGSRGYGEGERALGRRRSGVRRPARQHQPGPARPGPGRLGLRPQGGYGGQGGYGSSQGGYGGQGGGYGQGYGSSQGAYGGSQGGQSGQSSFGGASSGAATAQLRSGRLSPAPVRAATAARAAGAASRRQGQYGSGWRPVGRLTAAAMARAAYGAGYAAPAGLRLEWLRRHGGGYGSQGGYSRARLSAGQAVWHRPDEPRRSWPGRLRLRSAAAAATARRLRLGRHTAARAARVSTAQGGSGSGQYGQGRRQWHLDGSWPVRPGLVRRQRRGSQQGMSSAGTYGQRGYGTQGQQVAVSWARCARCSAAVARRRVATSVPTIGCAR